MSKNLKDLEVVGSNKNTTKKDESNETISVKKATFDALQERLNRLEASADKKRLARYDVSHRESYGEKVGIRVFEGKRVIGWSNMLTNSVKKNPVTRTWREDQTVNIIFEDGKEKKVQYELFVSSDSGYQLELGIVKDKRVETINVKDRDGKIIEKRTKIIYKLEMDDGKVIEIDSKFVN